MCNISKLKQKSTPEPQLYVLHATPEVACKINARPQAKNTSRLVFMLVLKEHIHLSSHAMFF